MLDTTFTSYSPDESEPRNKLIIWDVDDTLLSLLFDELKNHSILIPILLYISHSPILKSAICTNRRSRDEKPIEDDLSLAELLELLETFGIEFHRTLIITLGDVKEGLELLQREYGEHEKRRAEEGLVSQPPLNILGKNFQINRLHNAANILFQNLLNTESIFLVDDNTRIVEDCIKAQYRGIRATDPSNLTIAATNIDYLTELADHIGLSEYLHSLTMNPESHRADPSLQKIAAILYGLNTQYISSSITPCFFAPLFRADEIGPAVISALEHFKLYCETHTSVALKNRIHTAAHVSEKTKQRQIDFLAAESPPEPFRDAIVRHLNILLRWLQPFIKTPRTFSAPAAWTPSSRLSTNSRTSGILSTEHCRPKSAALSIGNFPISSKTEDPPATITWAYGAIKPSAFKPFNNAAKSDTQDLSTEPKKLPRYE